MRSCFRRLGGVRGGKSASDAIEAAGAYLLYLPPYSPDLNPIEMAFAKFKSRSAPRRSAQWTNCGRR
jgi:transposase